LPALQRASTSVNEGPAVTLQQGASGTHEGAVVKPPLPYWLGAERRFGSPMVQITEGKPSACR